MNRRQLLGSGAALGLLPAAACANPDTLKRFHTALERDPTLSVYADMVGERAGDPPGEQISAEELRLMADTMPGEGPGD